MTTLITGGSGCGKSYYAERLIARLGAGTTLLYIATMEAMDDECRKRIARHQTQRASLGFDTAECPTGLDKLIIPPGTSAILECVPTLMANEMFSECGDVSAVMRGIKHLAASCGNLVVVTNDVCADGVTYDPETERYKALLGGINREIAQMSDNVIEVVYTIPTALKGVLP